MNKLICFAYLSVLFLSGCTALDFLPAMGGGTSSKGHGNDNTLMVGSDVQQGVGNSQSSTDQTVKSNSGEVIAGNKQQQSAQAINNHHAMGLDVWQLILIVLLCLLVPSPFTPLYDRFKRWVS